MSGTFTESTVEAAAERRDYGEVVLAQRLHNALLPKLTSGEIRTSTREGIT